MSKLNLLCAIPTLHSGGSEQVLLTFLKFLDRNRFNATLAVVDLGGATKLDQIPQDVELVDLRARRVRYALPKLLTMARKRRPDVFLSTLGHLNMAVGACRSMFPPGMRMVARESSIVSMKVAQSLLPSAIGALARRSYPRFDHIVCQSAAMQEDLVERFRVRAQQTSVIRNPVDTARIRELATCDRAAGPWALGSDPDVVNLVAVGRLNRVKRFDRLLDAFARAGQPAWRLLIVGDGPERPNLQAQVARLALEDRVCLVGQQANPYPFIANADVLVLSSDYEGLPNVVLEAFACGTPVVAVPAPGGTPEVLRGVDGCMLAEACTVQALASALRAWGASPRRRLDPEVALPYRAETITRRFEAALEGT